MFHKTIECPTCGNETTAKIVKGPQKCKWCRRLFKVNIINRNKWEAEAVDFEENQSKNYDHLW